MKSYRSERIARSEVIKATNWGTEEAYKESGVVDGKIWLTAFDERTCEFCASLDGKTTDLGKKERALLKLFIQNNNRIIKKDEMLYHLWPHDDVSESALKNLLNRLRSKIGFDLIVSVKGSGWRLNTAL